MIPLTTPAAKHLHILVQRLTIDPYTHHTFTFVLVTLGCHFLNRVQIQDKRPYFLRSDKCQHRYLPCKNSKGGCLLGLKR